MSKFEWTDEKNKKLRKFHARGWTFLQMATYFGVTRSAIAGKVQRLDLIPPTHLYKLRTPPSPARKIAPAVVAAVAISKPEKAIPPADGLVSGSPVEVGGRRCVPSPLPHPPLTSSPLSAPAPIRSSRLAPPPKGGLRFMEQRDGLCHWPLTQDTSFDGFRVCGAGTKPGASYCDKHQDKSSTGRVTIPRRKPGDPFHKANSIILMSRTIR